MGNDKLTEALEDIKKWSMTVTAVNPWDLCKLIDKALDDARRTPAETVIREVVWKDLVEKSYESLTVGEHLPFVRVIPISDAMDIFANSLQLPAPQPQQTVSREAWDLLAEIAMLSDDDAGWTEGDIKSIGMRADRILGALPAPQPVSTGEVPNAVDFDGVVKCVCGNRPVVRHVTHGQLPSMDDYWQVGCHHQEAGAVILVRGDTKQSVVEEWNKLASRPPVPSVVGVPSEALIRSEIANRVQWSAVDDNHIIASRHVDEAAKAIHARLLTRQPDLGAVVKEAINRIEDMLRGDDGQAWKEAQKFVDRVKKVGAL